MELPLWFRDKYRRKVDFSLDNLHQAVRDDNIETIRKILSKNPELLKHGRNREMSSKILKKTIRSRQMEISELLVKFGADVNFARPLEIAMNQGNVKLTELLLNNGALIQHNFLLVHSMSHIFRLNSDTRKDMVKLLLKNGLDVEYRDDASRNFLQMLLTYQMAKDFDDVETAEILINHGVLIDQDDLKGRTALTYCIEINNVRMLNFLIKKGASVNGISNSREVFPLLVAVYCNNINIVNVLLSNGAEINAKNKHGLSALHQACFNYQLFSEKLISLLINKGADISAEDKEGETPFGSINRNREKYRQFRLIFIKEFAKLAFENISISEKDLKFIESDPNAHKLFESCKVEVELMRRTKFHGDYYSVLKMSKNIKKLVNLSKNREFLKNFRANLCKFILLQERYGNNFERGFSS